MIEHDWEEKVTSINKAQFKSMDCNKKIYMKRHAKNSIDQGFCIHLQ